MPPEPTARPSCPSLVPGVQVKMSTPSPKNTIETALDEITAESGMAVVIVDRDTNVVALSNDN